MITLGMLYAAKQMEIGQRYVMTSGDYAGEIFFLESFSRHGCNFKFKDGRIWEDILVRPSQMGSLTLVGSV